MSTRTTIDNALEVRAERLRIVSRGWARRRGTSDRVEVGDANASDVVVGAERTRIGGSLSEEVGGSSSTRASRLDTNVHGHLKVSCKSETTLLGGAMADTQLGGLFVGAGMSDDLIAGGGARVTAAVDVWLAGLIGMEEKVGTVLVDPAFLEMYHTLFEREHGVGKHIAMTATFNGMVHATMKAGFRPMMKVMRSGVRNLVRGGGGGAAAPSSPAPTPPAGGTAAGTGLLETHQPLPSADTIVQSRNFSVDDLAQLDELSHWLDEDLAKLDGWTDTLDEAFAAENQRLGLDSLETIGRTVGEGGSADGAVDLEDAQAAVRRLQGEGTDEVGEGGSADGAVDLEDAQAAVRRLQGEGTDEAAGVSNEVARAPLRNDNGLRYTIGLDPDWNYVLTENSGGPWCCLEGYGTGGGNAGGAGSELVALECP